MGTCVWVQDITNSMIGLAQLFHHPSNDLLFTIAHYALRHWQRLKPQEAAGLLWALALLKGVPPDTWKSLLERLAEIPASSFDQADLRQLYQMYLLLDSATDACALLTLLRSLSPSVTWPPSGRCPDRNACLMEGNRGNGGVDGDDNDNDDDEPIDDLGDDGHAGRRISSRASLLAGVRRLRLLCCSRY